MFDYSTGDCWRGAAAPVAARVPERVAAGRHSAARQVKERGPHAARQAGEDRREFAGGEAQGGDGDAADVAGGGRGHSLCARLQLRVRE